MKFIANKHVYVMEMRGVKYAVISVYEGNSTIQDRMRHLILNAFQSSKDRLVTEESSLDLVMDIPEES